MHCGRPGHCRRRGIAAVLTHLGENVADAAEAEAVTRHYLDLLNMIRADHLPAEISVKLTHLGLDLDPELCFGHLRELIAAASPGTTVWIDMESSAYVDITLELYRRARRAYANVGVCLQAYLYRTERDLESLLPLAPAIRLVKGAYRERPIARSLASAMWMRTFSVWRNVCWRRMNRACASPLPRMIATSSVRFKSTRRRAACPKPSANTRCSTGFNVPNRFASLSTAIWCAFSSLTDPTGFPGSCGGWRSVPPMSSFFCVIF